MPARSSSPPSAPVPGAVLLPPAFFARPTPDVARDLLGRLVVSTAGGRSTGGIVVEAEAYLGSGDAGSHAATRGVTARNAVMYGPPAHTYVYFTYGNHHMLNLVTEPAGTAGGVLVRAIEPVLGVETMRTRRMASRREGSPPMRDRDLTSGPGKVAAALGLDLRNNAEPLDGSATLSVWDVGPLSGEVATSGRIGLSAGHELELRFFVVGNPYVSTGRAGAPAPRVRTRKVR